jgi:hypothetical protein
MSLTVLLIYTVFASLFIGALFRPILGVLGYLAVYMLYNPDIWWGATFEQYFPRPSLVAVIFLITGSLLHAKKLNWTFSRREIELYLFLGAIWLSSLVFGVGMEDNNWAYLEKMTKLFVFIFFFIRVVDSLDKYKFVIWTFILGAIFLAYQAHTLSSGHFVGGRLDSLGGSDFREANGFAAFLAAAVTFAGVQMLRVSWWKKVLYIAGIALMLNVIIMTQSRAVFLGILMAVPYVFFRSPAERRKQVYACMALGMVLFFMLADVKFLGRMDTIKEAAKSGVEYGTEETLSRWDFWKASLPMFIDHPFGVGIKNFEKLVPYYDPRNIGTDAHNTYVLCYSEIGILGITLFLIIIVEAWRQLGRIRKMVADTPHERDVIFHAFALGIVLIIYLLGYMTTHSMLYAEIVWILLSMPICLENATRKVLEDEKIEDEKLGSGEGGKTERPKLRG